MFMKKIKKSFEHFRTFMTFQPSERAKEFLSSENPLTDTDFCPKEVLKFSPIPTSKYCKRSNFENFTSITKYKMDMQFNNVNNLLK